MWSEVKAKAAVILWKANILRIMVDFKAAALAALLHASGGLASSPLSTGEPLAARADVSLIAPG